MHRLSPLDTMFLLLERRHAPFHVGALSLFRPPQDAPADFVARLAKRLNQSLHAAPPFDRRLVSRFGVKFWDDDPDFDLAHHFTHLKLPRPAGVRGLPALVARAHGAPLDRAHPLWRTWLIEGLEDGRIAIYSKIHHAVVDGVAGIRLMLKTMSPDARASVGMPAPWQLRPARSQGGVCAHPAAGLRGVFGLASQGLKLAPAVFSHIKSAVRDFRAQHPDFVSSFQAPACLFNQPVSGARRFAARSYSTARIKMVAQRLGGCSNDVVLTLCAAALRRYLTDRSALPEKPLVAAVPVSLRQDDGDSGNEVAMALVNLATDVADPVERFTAIKSSMDYNKVRFRGMTPAQLLAYSAAMLAPGLLTMLPGIPRNIANVVISNVPGPRQPMYWQGCLLEGIYPASIVLDGFALNITLISRHDTMDFGVLACPHSVPHVQRLLGYLEDALLELEAAALTRMRSAPRVEPARVLLRA